METVPVDVEEQRVSAPAAEQIAGVNQKLNELWSENRAMLLKRMDMLEHEFWRWMRTPDQKAPGVIARDLAHKMAGVLGTFGLKRGSMIASTLERIAGMPRGAKGVGSSTVYSLLSELRSVLQAKR